MSIDTGKSAMTREEAQRLIQEAVRDIAKAIPKGGANVNVGVQDQRFTKLIGWAWLIIGAAGVSVFGWGVTSIQELNVKVGILISQHDTDTDSIRDLRDRVKVLEARK